MDRSAIIAGMHAHYAMLALAIFAVGLGLLMWLSPDTMWRFRQWRNRASGVATSERTPTWERMNRIAAIAVLLCGVGGAGGFWYFSQLWSEEEARMERAREMPPLEVDLGWGDFGDFRESSDNR